MRGGQLCQCLFVTTPTGNVARTQAPGFRSVKVHECFMSNQDRPGGVKSWQRFRTVAMPVGMPLG
jgi:hypothetical protein